MVEVAATRLSLLFYGVVGPYAEIDAYLDLEADLHATPLWVLYGGLEVPVGVKAEVLGHLLTDYETIAISYRLALAQAQSNDPPDTPSGPSPADGATDQCLNKDLIWVGGDPDGNAVTYDVFLEANDSTPDELICGDVVTTTCDPGRLSYETPYHWKVIARDEHGATTEGTVWQFTTISMPATPPQEDFESCTDEWQPFLNYWRLSPEQWYVEAGAGVGGSKGLKHAYTRGEEEAHDALYMYRGAGAEQWTDYRVEAKVLTEGTHTSFLGLLVRGKYLPSDLSGLHVEGYYVTWQPNRSTDSVRLWRLRNSGDYAYNFGVFDSLAAGDRMMNPDTWYELAVEVRGSNIKVFVDGDLVLEHDDATYGTGTIGMYAYKGLAAWDDLVVLPLE